MRETLNLNKERIEVPTDYSKLIQTITICAPTQKLEMDIDVTNTATLPAIIESALMLVAQIEEVSPTELAGFFGLNNHERDVLVNDMIETDLVKFRDDGDLVSTPRLLAQRREGNGISIEEVKNFSVHCFIDQITGYIQPRSESNSSNGMPLMKRSFSTKDYSQLLSTQFGRFKETFHANKETQELKRPQARLYRVNRASTVHSGQPLALTLAVNAVHDPLTGIKLQPELSGFTDENKVLVTKSGLVSEAIKWLNGRTLDKPSSSIQDYCDTFNDPVIARYIKGDRICGTEYIDLPRLLHDRQFHRTGYKNKDTHMMIGPVYAPGSQNRDKLLSWAKYHAKNKPMHQGLWLVADNNLFGASVAFETFMKDMNHELSVGDRNSSLNLLYKMTDGNDDWERRRDIQNGFNNRCHGKLMSYEFGIQDSNVEIMVFPGNNGCALVQYHAPLHSNLELAGMTVPIGYFTTDPERVNFLWTHVRQRISSKVTRFNDDKAIIESINKQLECDISQLDELLVDKSAEKLELLLSKFGRQTS
ncbi:hypothetical protein L1D24_05200 [Vibrio brasiliensis]|uniref:hypothetical protein n=1 Tax=Vibrio brasiliensis TaxID=170652 RepID=UPI001EFC8456|nr:hypothetical protein [Vibrio brasiliensis]MCG9647968.1 hypothetical protein [Vibrio brasiliensis]